jgi:hypothetical protein
LQEFFWVPPLKKLTKKEINKSILTISGKKIFKK